MDKLARPAEGDIFLLDLKKFHTGRGTPIRQFPILDGFQIDLFELYNVVTSLGGIEKVNSEEKWDTILNQFHLNTSYTNACQALKYIYQRYLDAYEKVNFFGEDPDHKVVEVEDSLPGQKKKNSQISLSAPLSYNHLQHYLTKSQRQHLQLSSYHQRSYLKRLQLSLLSGLPNEVDYALNVCTLLSSEGKHSLQISSCSSLLDILLAHVGVWPTHEDASYIQLPENGGGKRSRKTWFRFWLESVNENVRHLVSTTTALPSDRYNGVLHLGCAQGVEDAPGQRVEQIALILRNLSFEQRNSLLMATNPQVIKFLVLCVNSKYNNLRQLAMDTLGNLASQVHLHQLEEWALKSIFNLITKGIVSNDKCDIICAMEVVGSLCQQQSNEDSLATKLDCEFYERLISYVTVEDIQLLVCALECLYQLSELGESTASVITTVNKAVFTLLNLVTVEAQSFGPNSVKGIKVVEQIPAYSLSQTAQRQPATPDATSTPSQAKTPQPVAHLQPSTNTTETFARCWLQANFEACINSVISLSHLFKLYLQACVQSSGSSQQTNSLNSRGLYICLRTVFPMVSKLPSDSSSDADIVIKGIQVKQSKPGPPVAENNRASPVPVKILPKPSGFSPIPIQPKPCPAVPRLVFHNYRPVSTSVGPVFITSTVTIHNNQQTSSNMLQQALWNRLQQQQDHLDVKTVTVGNHEAPAINQCSPASSPLCSSPTLNVEHQNNSHSGFHSTNFQNSKTLVPNTALNGYPKQNNFVKTLDNCTNTVSDPKSTQLSNDFENMKHVHGKNGISYTGNSHVVRMLLDESDKFNSAKVDGTNSSNIVSLPDVSNGYTLDSPVTLADSCSERAETPSVSPSADLIEFAAKLCHVPMDDEDSSSQLDNLNTNNNCGNEESDEEEQPDTCVATNSLANGSSTSVITGTVNIPTIGPAITNIALSGIPGISATPLLASTALPQLLLTPGLQPGQQVMVGRLIGGQLQPIMHGQLQSSGLIGSSSVVLPQNSYPTGLIVAPPIQSSQILPILPRPTVCSVADSRQDFIQQSFLQAMSAETPPPTSPSSSLTSSLPSPVTSEQDNRKRKQGVCKSNSKAKKKKVEKNIPPPAPALPYICEWKGCPKSFDQSKLLVTHVVQTHLSTVNGSAVCQWANCDGLQRQRWSFITHMQEKHLTEEAMRLSFQRRQHKSSNGEECQTSQSPLVYPPDAAWQAVKRFGAHTPYQEFQETKEGPVTKHIRLTAALILRNLARYSPQARRQLRSEEQLLAYVALSSLEASSILASCLQELQQRV